MKILRKRDLSVRPKVSIIVLDWSVRESFHTLFYLNRQRIDRSSYEIIWIEYYDRRAKEIDELIEMHEALGLPAPVDTWLVLGRPRDECYHKHCMYNIGILNAQGEIITILDSDAIVKTTFVETILDEFDKEKALVLHFEQLRNFDQRFYPFNYPSIDMILGPGCIMPYKVNLDKGAPEGFETAVTNLKQEWGIMHVYNYGACFCAMRKDIIRIGGSDEHIDYMGHICGPYEMTFRLINAGINDSLHTSHFLYHVWHPNQGGDNNYCGPNNGKGMSTTAMEIPKTGRVYPLKENEEIKKLRFSQQP